MALIYQIPRNCLTWLLVAQGFLIAPHFSHLPSWILFAWGIIVMWRVQVYRGHWSFPGRGVKFGLVILCVIGLIFEYRRWYGLEPMIGLLVIAFLLKLLEMHRKRDALSVIYIAYFVASTHFLFSQTLEMTAYILLTTVLVTTTLVALNQSEKKKAHWHSFSLAGKLILQSIPLALVLFVVMPRVGSLWAVPQQQGAAKTGVSDTMSPGDFSRLSRSEEVAFRVTFDGDIPTQNQLYWRGLVFSYFDGRTWSPSRVMGFSDGGPVNWFNRDALQWRENIEVETPGLDYDVIIEPTHQNWLYALSTPTTRDESIGLTRDYNLIRRLPIDSRSRYRATSYLNNRLDAKGLPPWLRQRETQLPANGNVQSKAQAEQWWAEAQAPQAYITKVLDHYRQSFVYTLEPPLLGQDSIDEFLWTTQRGFCEHFASSFVFMMRTVGIPARVVVGYQGGELNALENFLIIKQSDAHAWAEVWLEGEGWVRFDPTAAVAPGRIEYGLSAAVSEQDLGLLSQSFLAGYDHIALMNMLRLRLEVLNYQWSTWVVSYDSEAQSEALRRLLGGADVWRIAAAFLGSGTSVLGLLGLWLFLSGYNFQQDKGDRLYRRFLKQLESRGVEKRDGEGPKTFALRAGRRLPSLKAWILQVSQYYESYRYGGDRMALNHLAKALKSKPR